VIKFPTNEVNSPKMINVSSVLQTFTFKLSSSFAVVDSDGAEIQLKRPLVLIDVQLRSFHSTHNVVDYGVVRAMWEELAGKVVHRKRSV